MITRIRATLFDLRTRWWCILEACRRGQSWEYRTWRLKEAFGIDPEK